jgi:hypothetical protein
MQSVNDINNQIVAETLELFLEKSLAVCHAHAE